MSIWQEMVKVNLSKAGECFKKNRARNSAKSINFRIGQNISSPNDGYRLQSNVRALILLVCILSTNIVVVQKVAANQLGTSPDWRPQSSEKLIKLPSTYLKKSIDSHFSESTLSKAIENNRSEGRMKIQSLTDLKGAIHGAEGEVKTELRHQLLAEKQSYINIISQKNQLRWQQLMTKQRLFERMLKKISRQGESITISQKVLIENQDIARKRFENTISKVDLRLFETNTIPESTYARKYSSNMAVIEKLLKKVNDHRMNKAVQVNGHSLSKKEYIKHLLKDTQSEIAILEQEETILGYMAKLVALDALTLSEEALDAGLSKTDEIISEGPGEVVELFLNN